MQAYAAGRGVKADILDLNNVFYNLAPEGLRKKWLISCQPGFEKDMLNILRVDFVKEFEKALEKMLGYYAIGFSCFKSNFKTSLEIARILKGREEAVKIIFGGPEITRQFFKTGGNFNDELKSLADLIVVGEGEKPFLNYLRDTKNNAKIAAFVELDSLDNMPFASYEGLDLEDYPRERSISIFASRGCPRRCRFCSERLLYRKFRARPVKDVISEIRFFREEKGIEYFVFHDSMINADPRWLEDLCDAIIENFGSIRWEAQMAIRADMNDKLFNKLKKSGCYHLFVGLESGSDKTLKSMKKGYSCKDALVFFQRLKNAGLSFGVSMIVGYPTETESDYRDSVNFIIENRDVIPKIEQVNPFVYYDGTDVCVDKEAVAEAESEARLRDFIKAIKENNIKYTNAFVGNLIEKDG